jgi:SAM-dependent methyltransferase
MLSANRIGSLLLLIAAGACARSERPAIEPPPDAPPAPEPPPEKVAEATETRVGESAAGTAEPAEPAEPREDAAKRPDVVYVPTPPAVVDRMLQMAKVEKGDLLYDLGSGDGRIVITAAKKFGARGMGFDVDPERIAEARANAKQAGVEHLVTFEQRDIFTVDLSPADVVTLYLLPELNVRLIPQLQKLRPGARIVSHDFDMRGVEPRAHVELAPPNEDRTHEVYLWHAPIKESGS